MAKLTSENLTLEIRYRDFQWGWVVYDIRWLWGEDLIINDDILSRNGVYWGGRSKGAWTANEDEYDCIAPFIRRVLETSESDFIETLEPDITLAIYSNDGFPFIPSQRKILYERPDAKEERTEWIAKQDKALKHPDQDFELILFVDTYNFRGSSFYSGNGMMLRLQTDRRNLTIFLEELEREYADFKIRFDVDNYNRLRPDSSQS